MVNIVKTVTKTVLAVVVIAFSGLIRSISIHLRLAGAVNGDTPDVPAIIVTVFEIVINEISVMTVMVRNIHI